MTLNDLILSIDINQFKLDYYNYTAQEMQIKYNLSEYYYFSLVHSLDLQKRRNNYTLEDLYLLLPKDKLLIEYAKGSQKDICKKYNITPYQLRQLQNSYDIKTRKAPQTYNEFKACIDTQKFIDFVLAGNTDYAGFLKTKNNRFINRLLDELSLKKRKTLDDFLQTINLTTFIAEFPKYSIYDLAIKYNVSPHIIQTISKQLNLKHTNYEKRIFWEKTALKNANSTDIDSYKSKIAYKSIATKNKKGSICASKLEVYIATKLKELYDTNVQTQIKTKVYPYYCDIYLQHLDTYIEVNGHYTHGYHPFNSNNKADAQQLLLIKQKQAVYTSTKGYSKKNSYYTWERVWTQRDPAKLATAVKNNLNYILVYMDKDQTLQILLCNANLDVKFYSDLFNNICKDSRYKIKKIQYYTV